MANVTEELELKHNDVTVFKLTEDMTGINPLDSFNNIRDQSGSRYALIPRDLRVAYEEPRVLTVLGLADPPNQPLTPHRSRLKLYVNGTLRFNGLVKDVEDQDAPTGRQIVYRAYDAMEEANDLIYLNPGPYLAGLPTFQKQAAIIPDGTAGWTYTWLTLNVLIDELLTDMPTEFAARGIPTTHTGTLPNFIFNNIFYIKIDNQTIKRILDGLISNGSVNTASVRYLIDPTVNTWVFYDTNTLPSLDFTIGDSVNPIIELGANLSVRGRYSAVRIIGMDMVPPYAIMAYTECTPAWTSDSDMETSWTPSNTDSLSEANFKDPNFFANMATADPRSLMFRLWRFSTVGRVLTDSPYTKVYRLLYNTTDDIFFHQLEINARIDWDRGLLLTKDPVLAGTTVSRPHRFVNYRINREYIMKFPLTERGRCFLRYVQLLPEQNLAYGVRIPPTGYGGQAYSQFGIEHEYAEMSQGSSTEAIISAVAKSNELSTIGVTQSVPVLGAMNDNLWNLGYTANIRRVGSSSGYESMNALITGFTHEFAGGGRTNYDFTTKKLKDVGV